MFSTHIHIPAENALIPKMINIYGWINSHQISFAKSDHEICGSGINLRIVFAREQDASAVAMKFEGEFRQVS